jgi:hypothetical protein
MPFTHVPTTPEGRAVHIAAFELAVQLFDAEWPGALTGRHQDAMVETIIDMIASGATDVEKVARYAVASARAVESADA